MELRGRWILTVLGGLAVLYAVVVLGYVATSPDLRIRALLVDEAGEPSGVQIRATSGMVVSVAAPKAAPQSGDTLVRAGDRPIRNFYDFASFLRELRNVGLPPGGLLNPDDDPAALEELDLPPLVENNRVGTRWVQIEYLSRQEGAVHTAWLKIQDVPLSDLWPTFVWLLFHLAICGVAALAWWHRPFDRTARLFFGMSTVTLAAFVGGYHWHTLAGNLWLSLPLILVSAMLPSVTLHFFLNFPRPKSFVLHWPRAVMVFVYLPPALAIGGVLTLVSSTWVRAQGKSPEEAAVLVESMLGLLRSGVYFYMVVGVAYFALTLLALLDSLLTTRNPVENRQVKGILKAAAIAAALVVYTFFVALTDQVGFALGRARLPLFLASVSLNLAYAVAIVRHKLMLLDQLVSKGVWYWIVSSGLTLAVSLTIAASSLLDQFFRVTLTYQQSFAAAAVLGLAVLLLLWLRDFGQQAIDQRFFREKYQLDRALQQVNRAIGHLGDPESLGQMMLGSCGDVLRIDGGALFLRTAPDGPFQLVASTGPARRPLSFVADDALLMALRAEGSLQRVAVSTRAEMTSAQNALRALQADLIHAIETNQGIDGLVVLGEKVAGGPFTAEDLTYLNALTQITHVALQTARIRQEMERLNDDLQRKTERLTDQGRQIAILQAELTTAAAPSDEPPPTEAAAAEPAPFKRDALRGNSPAILRVLDTARKVAASESTVLIRGESGTGKELLAQVLHDNSPRRDGPLVRVHCAALSQGLLESELFGHAKGAFTGAHKDRVGRFEAANGGTLFLDEIGDITLETQIKLLRVLQERQFEPVGSSRTVEVDVRLVTATHQDLEKLIAQGKFREDLYYRLNVIRMTLPALRERREDVLELSLFFLSRAAARLSKRVTHLDEESLAALEAHPWPGNIRELENVIERAVVLADGERITLRELPPEIMQPDRVWPVQVIEAKPTGVVTPPAAAELLKNKPGGSAPHGAVPPLPRVPPSVGTSPSKAPVSALHDSASPAFASTSPHPTARFAHPMSAASGQPVAASSASKESLPHVVGPPALSKPPAATFPATSHSVVPPPAPLPSLSQPVGGQTPAVETSTGQDESVSLDDAALERRQLVETLRLCNGNKAKAARRLGVPRSTFFSRLKKYGIE